MGHLKKHNTKLNKIKKNRSIVYIIYNLLSKSHIVIQLNAVLKQNHQSSVAFESHCTTGSSYSRISKV